MLVSTHTDTDFMNKSAMHKVMLVTLYNETYYVLLLMALLVVNKLS